jgi:Holliday junction resolvase-like predicted endonuclease
MEIVKSSRHQKIIGNFGENLICNWLSRSGFEVTIVDHTGMDIIAYNPATKRRLGITVKSRTRNVGKEETTVNIFSRQKGKDDRQKLIAACEAFSCEPWIGVYVETSRSAYVYLTSLNNYDSKYLSKAGKAIDDWKMGRKDRERYERDPDVKHIRIEFHDTNWDWGR